VFIISSTNKKEVIISQVTKFIDLVKKNKKIIDNK